MSSREYILGRLREVGGRMLDAGGIGTDDRRPMTEDGTWDTENGTSDSQLPTSHFKLQTSNFPLPTSHFQLPSFNTAYLGDPLVKFKELIDVLHGEAIEVSGAEEIEEYIAKHYDDKRVLTSTTLSGLNNSDAWKTADPHSLEDVEFTLVEGTLGVAENGAIWLTEEQLSQRVAPFINQQLGILIKKDSIVPTMAQAYEKLGEPNSGFGVFIAGPSKTADIEQSLVTGAHGARGLVVFLI